MSLENRKKCILVLGMHRSGTSAVAGLLADLGVFFGTNLMEATADNPKGYYENMSIYRVNDNILRILKSSWDDINELPEKWYELPEITLFKTNIKQIIQDELIVKAQPNVTDISVFGIKDPRLSILLPLYVEVFKEIDIDVSFLIIKRNEVEICKSLEKRDGFSFEKSLKLIKKYEHATQVYTKVFEEQFKEGATVFFEDVVRNPILTATSIQKVFELKPVQLNKEHLFVESSLKHNTVSYPDLLLENEENVRNLKSNIQKGEETIGGLHGVIENLQMSISSLNTDIAQKTKQIESIEKIVEEKTAVLVGKDANIDVLTKSISEGTIKIEELKRGIVNSESKLAVLQKTIDTVSEENVVLKNQNNRRVSETIALQKEIDALKNSLAWRFSQWLVKVFFVIFPDNYKMRNFVDQTVLFLHKVFKKKKLKTLAVSEKIKTEYKKFSKNPLISIVIPTYNSELKFLHTAIESVKRQTYSNWELIIVDDGSTKKETKEYLKNVKDPKVTIKLFDTNEGISKATGKAVQLCKGEYIAFLDHDDELTFDALYEVVSVINLSDADIIYSDEDKIDENGNFSIAHYKPDYSPDLLLSQNYINHLTVIKREIVAKTGAYTTGLDGAQDYDLLLRATELTNKVAHIPKILYHWRITEGSTAVQVNNKRYAITNGKKALENALVRRGIEAEVLIDDLNGNHGYFRVKRKILGKPLVSIVIPFKNKLQVTKTCIDSVLSKTTYENYEIIAIDHFSDERGVSDWKKEVASKNSNISFFDFEGDFNYSRINNFGVNLAKGEHIMFLNNDVEIITGDWIEAMLEHSQRHEVGMVGAKLYYPDDTIQHAGVIIGLGGVAGHAHKRLKRSAPCYFGRASVIQNLSAVTGACMMIKKDLYLSVGGMDESLTVEFNDVDVCLRIKNNGYINVYTPYAELYHYESYTRGSNHGNEKQARSQRERAIFTKRHSDILQNGDPYYNKNLTLKREDFTYSEEVIELHASKRKPVYREDFDWLAYINDNQDIREAGIDTEKKAWEHWLKHGVKEGRAPKLLSESALLSAEKFGKKINWFFCLNDNSDHIKEASKVAVVSAKYFNINKFCVYYGTDQHYIDFLEQNDVKVIRHTFSLLKEAYLANSDATWRGIASGAFLRIDIPKIIKDQKLFDDEYYLYTDSDVIFQKDPSVELLKLTPKYFYASSQMVKKVSDFFNTGVMWCNINTMYKTYEEFLKFMTDHDFKFDIPGFDQPALNVFYAKKWNFLDFVFNWKPYWGINEDAYIIHFHGPAPKYYLKVKNNLDKVVDAYKSLLNKETLPAYDFYVKKYLAIRDDAKNIEKSEPLYSFLHIAKTAGTTVREHVVSDMYRDEYICCYTGDSFFADEKDMEKYLLSKTKDNKLKLVYGHLIKKPYLKDFDREIRDITFLRNPVTWYISLYNHMRGLQENGGFQTIPVFNTKGEVLSFYEWFGTHAILTNYMAGWLMLYFNGKRPLPIEEKHTGTVKDILKSFYFVGIVEHPDDFKAFYRIFGAKPDHVDKNISKKYFAPDENEMGKIEEIIRKKSPVDFEIYDFALKLNKNTNQSALQN